MRIFLRGFLGSAMLFAFGQALAIPVPDGTIRDRICGATATFPGRTIVCLADKVGTDEQYIGISAVVFEIGSPTLTYHPIVETQSGHSYTTYKAIEQGTGDDSGTYTLAISHWDDQSGHYIGSLRYNEEFIFGGEVIRMEAIYYPAAK